ncbi:LysE family transporter [Streptomyces sp. NPDC050416]|uniref:LysE family transporter n=1 Tax=Streptomyces sp. NPDC050416 TaxID=3365611 RepID=UPI003790B27F
MSWLVKGAEAGLARTPGRGRPESGGPTCAGVGKLLDIPVLRTAPGLAGALVMAYLGVRSVRSAFRARSAVVDADGETVQPWEAFRTALTATAANPATIGYWAAAFAAATAANVTGTLADSLAMLVGVGSDTLLWFTILSAGAMPFRRWFTSRMLHGVDLLAGVGVICVGGVLAYQAVG